MAHDELRLQLEQVSRSFCPLRWTYMQVDLEHGKVKACCKTPFQSITDEQIRELGAGALFNGHYVQQRRREMLAGIKHDDCSTCWTEEELGLLSYRYLQSGKEPFRSSIASISAQAPVVNRATPKHVEIILNTNCDLKCSYCGPEFSSAWAVELKREGPFPVRHDNPQIAPAGSLFLETFWQWFEEELSSIAYVQFNGGEPLLQNEFYKFLTKILDSSERVGHLQVGVISNLNTPPGKLERLRKILPPLLERHGFRFGISQDSVGKRAEYIRSGLKWQRFDENLRALLADFPGLSVQIAPTMSALNVTSIKSLLIYAAQLSDQYGAEIIMRPSIVMWPDFQSPLILPKEYVRYLEDAIRYLEESRRWPIMRERLSEIREATEKVRELDPRRKIFYDWFKEYDRRRKVSFLEVFPEMEGFWSYCARL